MHYLFVVLGFIVYAAIGVVFAVLIYQDQDRKVKVTIGDLVILILFWPVLVVALCLLYVLEELL